MTESNLLSAFRHWRRMRARPAVYCLAKARADVAAGTRRYASPIWTGYSDAPKVTRHGSAYVANLADAGLRFVGFADDLTSLRHTGWHADSFGDRKYRGAVLQLPGHKGAARFVAGYQESDNDGFVLDLSPRAVFSESDCRTFGYETAARDLDAAVDAARAADGFAERDSKDAHEYDSAWQAGSQWSQLGADVAESRREVLQILKERRAVPAVDAPALCAAIRARVESILDEMREARERRAKLAEGEAEGLMFWPGDAKLRAAFCEGSGVAEMPA